MAAQVRRTISPPFRATRAHLDTGPLADIDSRSCGPLCFSDAQAAPSVWIEVDNPSYCADPLHTGSAGDPSDARTPGPVEVELCDHPP
jgi:hypothetical protein